MRPEAACDIDEYADRPRFEVGKLADLIVLAANLLNIDMYEIGETAVHLTMMNGVVTHRAGI